MLLPNIIKKIIYSFFVIFLFILIFKFQAKSGLNKIQNCLNKFWFNFWKTMKICQKLSFWSEIQFFVKNGNFIKN